MDIPEGYSQDEWAEYQADPVGFCIKELNSSDPSVRCNAADILRGMVADAELAIPALTAGLNDSDNQVKAQCIFALADIGFALGELPTETILALAICLCDTEAEIRALAANALRIGKNLPREIIAHLKGMITNDPDEEVRQYAAVALRSIRI